MNKVLKKALINLPIKGSVGIIIATVLYYLFHYYNVKTNIFIYPYIIFVGMLIMISVWSISINSLIKLWHNNRRLSKGLIRISLLFAFSLIYFLETKSVPIRNLPDAVGAFFFVTAIISIFYHVFKLLRLIYSDAMNRLDRKLMKYINK